MSRAAFITFEGIDGCGKSTQLRMAAAALRARGMDIEVTREPGGTPIAEHIREVVMSAEHGEMVPPCEVLLYLAARAQHVAERIGPALRSGKVVLCDRYQEATFAYQGFGRGIALDTLTMLNRFATGGLEPTLTFVFDLSVDVAGERLVRSGKAPDRMEANARDFHERIREGYLALAAAHPKRIVLLAGDRPADETSSAVLASIERHLAST